MRISREPRGPGAQSLTTAKLILAAVGLFIWSYGARVDDSRFRWVGIGFFVVALLLRFSRRQRGGD